MTDCPRVSKPIIFTLYVLILVSFILQFVSSRETMANIKLITTAMIITKRNYLTCDNIRYGLNAYELVCRETKNDENESKSDYLFLSDDKIHRALRLVNMTISEQIFNIWLSHVKSNLEWSKQDKVLFEN